MKRITLVLPTDSLERQFAQVIEGRGYPCPTVVEFGEATTPKGTSLVAKAECSDGSRYRIEASEDMLWVRVELWTYPLIDSFERGLQRIIEGNGFKCSRATDTYEITRGKLFKVMCPEGVCKLTGNAASGFTVTEW